MQISVQEIIIVPTAAWFNCSAKGLNAKESIESIRWLKDEEEFYVYSATDGKDSQKVTTGKGIPELNEKSHNGNVFLHETNVNTTGCYKCVIKVTDGRSKEQEMRSTAVYLPLGKGFPSIEVTPKAPEDFDTYSPHVIVIASLGQTVRLNVV